MKNTLLVAAISMALVACSSGSSVSSTDSGKKADTPKKTQTDKKDTDTSKKVTSKKDTSKKDTPKKDTPKKDTPKKDTPKKDTPKKEPKLDRNDNKIDTVQKTVTQSKLNEFVLDGKKIIIPEKTDDLGFTKIQDKNLDSLVNAKYKYMRFGVLVPKGKDAISFAQGVETAINDMPTEDGIKYIGDSVTYDKGTPKDFEKGKLTAIANFKQHKLIANPEKSDKALIATIDGNKFSFEKTDGEGAGKGSGKFYGPQAAELSGTYVGKKHTTAFGAKRVK